MTLLHGVLMSMASIATADVYTIHAHTEAAYHILTCGAGRVLELQRADLSSVAHEAHLCGIPKPILAALQVLLNQVELFQTSCFL